MRKSPRTSKKFILVLVFVIVAIGLLRLYGIIQKANHSYSGKAAGQSIALIIPGMNENEDKYGKIEDYYKEAGITPVIVNVNWLQFNFRDLIEDTSEEIDEILSLYPDRDVYFFGFSFGAVIALNIAGEYESKGTILCSLSPIFADDLKAAPGWLKSIIQPPGYKSIPEETAVFLYGDKDNHMIRSDEIVGKRKKIYSKSEFKMVKGAKHDITGEAYLEQIKWEIIKLRDDDINE